MSSTLQKGGKCLICAFRAADRRLLSLSSIPQASGFSTFQQQCTRGGSKARREASERARNARCVISKHPSNHPRSNGTRIEARKDEEAEYPKQYASRSLKLPNTVSAGGASTPRESIETWADKEAKRRMYSNPGPQVVKANYDTLIQDMEEAFNAEDDGPRIGEISGIDSKDEFKDVAAEFWTEKLKPALDWAQRYSRRNTGTGGTRHVFGAGPLRDMTDAEQIHATEQYQKTYTQLFGPLWGPVDTGASAREKYANLPVKMRINLRAMLIDYIHQKQAVPTQMEHIKAMADFRYPTEWWPAARALQRKIHLHVGPTNSGKTYHALKRLEEAETGVYAGPLRLLAHEVYTRLNAKGKTCALITGEERRIPEGWRGHMSSCTVEMVPLSLPVDVAVIDEIQMLADDRRGWAWTQAFLGVQAKEVHLCGEVRTTEIIQRLCRLTGDELIIHNYERLSPLQCMGKSMKGLDKLQKGDAVIVFSRVGIHAMKKQIEAETGKRCAVIYGSLPPETRAQQAALFNDQNNDYDILVASDAVGMGLNLAIRRVIFESTVKSNGKGGYNQLSVSELKQIAGRAGRYKTAAEGVTESKHEGLREDGTPRHPPRNVGLATTMDPNDHFVLKTAMETDVEPIKAVGIFPPAWAYKRFASYFPRGTPFSYVLNRVKEIATVNPMFFLCDMHPQQQVCDAIEMFDLTMEDRMIFMSSPANMKKEPEVLVAFAAHVAAQTQAELYNIKEMEFELLDVEVEGIDYLQRLEKLHNAITLYLWLSYRFAGVFISQPLAFHVKGMVEEKIDQALAKVTALSQEEADRRRALRHKMAQELREAEEKAAREVEDAPNPYSTAVEDDQEPLVDPVDAAGMKGENLDAGLTEEEALLKQQDVDVEEDEDDDDDDPEQDAISPDLRTNVEGPEEEKSA